jgi:hypothetical protein
VIIFAGNYRGSAFPHLDKYEVGVGADPRVGVSPAKVKRHMHEFETLLSKALVIFDKAYVIAKAAGDLASLLPKLVSILGVFLTKFLTIHPYANGNGHMGRLIVSVLLGRYGFWPAAWPLHERPAYSELLSKHRDGDHAPLNKFLLRCIVGSSPSP